MDPLPPPGPSGWSSAPRPAAPTSPPLAPAAEPPTSVPGPPVPKNASNGPSCTRFWPTVLGILAIVVAAAVAGGGFAALVRARDEPSAAPRIDPYEVLARARAFVHAQESVQFEFAASMSFEAIDGLDVSVLSGTYESAIPTASRLIVEDSRRLEETIDIGTMRYSRSAPSGASLEGVEYELEDATGPAVALGVYDFGSLLDDVRDPQVMGNARGVTTLSMVDLSGVSFIGEPFQGIGQQEIIITVGSRGDVRSLTVQNELEGMAVLLTTDDLLWNAPVIIAEPDPSEIDPTPNIDESRLQAFSDATVLTPLHVPEGWELEDATVLAPEDTAEKCEQGRVQYVEPDGPGVLDLFSLPATCATAPPPDDATSITVPAGWGWIARVGVETHAELVINGTLLQVRTTLSIDHTLQLLEAIGAFDPGNPPPADLQLRTTS